MAPYPSSKVAARCSLRMLSAHTCTISGANRPPVRTAQLHGEQTAQHPAQQHVRSRRRGVFAASRKARRMLVNASSAMAAIRSSCR
ncbi:hypothetical protein EES42_17430 [Streptomyces sp. ADI95-17]|nr:hypothetical protein EES42_17430 [Streptomyces sp. ADI95-17]